MTGALLLGLVLALVLVAGRKLRRRHAVAATAVDAGTPLDRSVPTFTRDPITGLRDRCTF